MATLALNNGVRTAVWRLVKATLQADATYANAGVTLVFLDGNAEGNRGIDTFGGPALRFLPKLGNQTWYTEASTNAALIVNVEALLVTPDAEDLFNLQEALETTFDTQSNSTLYQAFLTAGMTGVFPLFTQPLNPAQSAAGANNVYRAVGQFVVETQRFM